MTVRPDPDARRRYGLRDAVHVGILIQLDGQALRIAQDGSVEPILPGPYPRPGVAHSTARVLP